MVTTVSEVSSTSAHVSSEHVLTVLDLFAGAGGLTAGLHAGDARFRTVCAVELDAEAAASYTQNYGDIVYVGDVADWMDRRDVPAVDVVVGGPPCQGFSTLGKQDVNDGRNVLWRHYVEAVRRAKPRAFVMENVPTFLSSREFQCFVDLFEDEGALRDYRFEAGVLNAADFGAAQARRRAVIVGTHRDIDHPGLPFPDEDVPTRTVRDAFAGITPFTGVTELPHRRVVFQGRSLPGVFRSRELHIGRDYSDLALARIRSIPYGGGRFDLPHALEAECWRRHRTGAGDVMGRLTWERPSVTIRTEFFKPEKGRYLHPTQHRAITHFEAARLQGFPDDYEFVGTRTSIARQIGNAVPIPLGAALGRHLGAVLS